MHDLTVFYFHVADIVKGRKEGDLIAAVRRSFLLTRESPSTSLSTEHAHRTR